MRCYLLPNNQLPFFTSYNRGYIDINEEKDYKVRILIADVVGNTSELNFTIKGVKKDIPLMLKDSGTYVDYRLPAIIQGDGYGMVLPRGSLYDNVYFDHKVYFDSTLSANVYQMHYQTEPLHKNANLFIQIPKDSVPTEKHYVARKGRRGDWNYVNTKVYNDSILRVKTNALGDFTVKVDTIAPEIRPQSRTKSRIMLKIVIIHHIYGFGLCFRVIEIYSDFDCITMFLVMFHVKHSFFIVLYLFPALKRAFRLHFSNCFT
jgi:hypothetical protein